jgi:hypothetical protein
MPSKSIGDLVFNTEDLSARGVELLSMSDFLDLEIQNIRAELQVYGTAKHVWVSNLRTELKQQPDALLD